MKESKNKHENYSHTHSHHTQLLLSAKMSSSTTGVKVPDETTGPYNKLIKMAPYAAKWMIFYIKNGQVLVESTMLREDLEKVWDKSAEKAEAKDDAEAREKWNHAQFVNAVLGRKLDDKGKPIVDSGHGESRFAAYDLPQKNGTKILLVMWNPDYAPAKAKMTYAGTFEGIGGAFPASIKVQATDLDELSLANLQEKAKQK